MLEMGSFDTDYHIDLKLLKVYCHYCRAVISADPTEGGKPLRCHSCGEYHIVPKSRFAPAVVIADFVLQSEIGTGGCGTVFLAYQISLDRYCALKILHDRIISEEKYLHELMLEGRLAGKLNHPNIVQCYAIGEEDGIYYYGMEHVDGKSLKDILNDKWKLTPSRSIDITLQVVAALNYAWSKERIVHRDIKPDNIMINHEGEVKLTDLGLALPEDAIQPDDEDTIKGSPQYISPEQLMDTKQDFRSDIYSLGAVLYHMLTGHFVFKAKTAHEMCQMHVDTPAPSPATLAPELPRELCNIILKMLAKSPEDRYLNYENLKADLISAKALVDTNTASQDLLAKTPPKKATIENKRKTQVKKKAQKAKSHVMHWMLSIILLSAFSYLCISLFLPKKTLESGSEVTESSQAVKVEPIIEKVDLLFQPLLGKTIAVKKAIVSFDSLMINPKGYDDGHEWISLKNSGNIAQDLKGWTLVDKDGQSLALSQKIEPATSLKVKLTSELLSLNNGGDEVYLKNHDGETVATFSYTKEDIVEGEELKVKADLNE